jgi:hypothetical protein
MLHAARVEEARQRCNLDPLPCFGISALHVGRAPAHQLFITLLRQRDLDGVPRTPEACSGVARRRLTAWRENGTWVSRLCRRKTTRQGTCSRRHRQRRHRIHLTSAAV